MTPVAPLFSTTEVGEDTLISSGAFFPDVSLLDFKNAMRIIDKNDAPVMASLQGGLYQVYHCLMSWAAEQISLGYATLAAVPSDIDLESVFKLSVYHSAKGKLVDQYRDMDTTKSGHDRADDLEMNADFHYLESRRYSKMLQGVSVVTATLI